MSRLPKNVLASVVTYNRKDLLGECLDALLSQSISCHVLIVDNASTDGTKNLVSEIIQKNQRRIMYHNMEKNTGGTGGFNFATRFAAENGYDFAWLMDDDCVPGGDALEKLLDADDRLGGCGNYGFLSSKVLWTDGNECRMNMPKFIDREKNLISQATFVSIFLPVSTMRKAGLPVKEFFIWGDDIEYTRRIAVRMNMPCYFVEQSEVVHKMKANTGSSLAVDVEDRLPRYFYAFRNECFLYRQEGFRGVCFYILRCAKTFAKILLKAKNLRFKRCATLIKGVLKGIAFNPKIEML